LSGIVSPANAASSHTELAYQFVDSKAKALFTCLPLLSIALEAAAKANISRSRIYLLDLPEELLKGAEAPSSFKTVSQLISQGGLLPKIEKFTWSPGQAATTTAFICYSSGTSGLPVR
jgi:long-subunit acyl-CoA synthetase (AMP-forming)